MDIIRTIKDLNMLVSNIITLFKYNKGIDNIEIQAQLRFPKELSDTSFIMKTSGNQSDCLIHSILIDISKDFRSLLIEHRNVIAFCFRKIVFPLIPGLTNASKNRLLIDPTLLRVDLYLELDELESIASYYGLNFMLITKDQINHIPIEAVNNSNYFIIHYSGNHFQL